MDNAVQGAPALVMFVLVNVSFRSRPVFSRKICIGTHFQPSLLPELAKINQSEVPLLSEAPAFENSFMPYGALQLYAGANGNVKLLRNGVVVASVYNNTLNLHLKFSSKTGVFYGLLLKFF